MRQRRGYSPASSAPNGVHSGACTDQIEQIHLFAAVPQTFMMMLGHSFNALPPVHVYEFDQDAKRYFHCLRITGNQL